MLLWSTQSCSKKKEKSLSHQLTDSSHVHHTQTLWVNKNTQTRIQHHPVPQNLRRSCKSGSNPDLDRLNPSLHFSPIRRCFTSEPSLHSDAFPNTLTLNGRSDLSASGRHGKPHGCPFPPNCSSHCLPSVDPSRQQFFPAAQPCSLHQIRWHRVARRGQAEPFLNPYFWRRKADEQSGTHRAFSRKLGFYHDLFELPAEHSPPTHTL